MQMAPPPGHEGGVVPSHLEEGPCWDTTASGAYRGPKKGSLLKTEALTGGRPKMGHSRAPPTGDGGTRLDGGNGRLGAVGEAGSDRQAALS